MNESYQKICLRVAEWFKTIAVGAFPKGFDQSTGLCTNFRREFDFMNETLRSFLTSLEIKWEDWEGFSGNRIYPVKGISCNAEDSYRAIRQGLYNGSYGIARLALAKWISERIKEKVLAYGYARVVPEKEKSAGLLWNAAREQECISPLVARVISSGKLVGVLSMFRRFSLDPVHNLQSTSYVTEDLNTGEKVEYPEQELRFISNYERKET